MSPTSCWSIREIGRQRADYLLHRNYNTTYQLDAGVRLVSAQVHKQGMEWHLCHTKCELLDAGKLSTWLGDIKEWLDENPNDGKSP